MSGFSANTLIATENGLISVSNLSVNDNVVTRDNGLQKIRWIGPKNSRYLENSWATSISRGSIFNVEGDLLVSAEHCILYSGWECDILFSLREVLIMAKYLDKLPGVTKIRCFGQEFFDVILEGHELILANGIWVESCSPIPNSCSDSDKYYKECRDCLVEGVNIDNYVDSIVRERLPAVESLVLASKISQNQ